MEGHLVDTGEGTMTGGRLKRVATYIGSKTFCMTYGDGVGDVDISAVVAAHKTAGKKRRLQLCSLQDGLGLYKLMVSR